jgi:cell division septation protein DedD
MSTDVRNATASSEDGFHEIHLSGKQLVFLFMATTVVSIVIFLCGVLVGRGVRTEAEATGTVQAAPVEALEQPRDGVGTAGSQATSVPASELGYQDRLGDAEPTADTVKSGTEVPEPAERTAPPPSPPPTEVARERPAPTQPPAPPARSPAPAPERAAAAAPPPASTTTAPAGQVRSGWTVQVAAVRQRSEADAIAGRLVAKGYDAYVVAPATGAATPMFRVRVGSYADRAEAERMMQRLTDQERFKPWITR